MGLNQELVKKDARVFLVGSMMTEVNNMPGDRLDRAEG
jgi:hypothetical protein